ncbi:MAG TPA: hypothetical protein VH560_09255, partial [Polyangia bacterium]|nr:hypothetical protein [Polyangia bacterium]
EVIFRGDFRARVPFAEIKSIAVKGDSLTLKWPGGLLALELGAAAAGRWADRIENPPSRLDKLGVKSGARVALVGSFDFDDAFEGELAKRGAVLTTRGAVDVLFFAPASPVDLERVATLAKRLTPAGGFWIVRPKGASTPITEGATRSAGLAASLVDVKVAAFSATHSTLKFVIPVANR